MENSFDYSRYYVKANKTVEDNLDTFIPSLIKLIEPLIPKDRNINILDVGCGRGYMLMALEKMGYHHTLGIDIDKWQIEACNSNGVCAQLVNDSESFLKEHANNFDVVLLFDVLEHIPTDNTIGFLSLIKESLKEDGILIVRVPNANSFIASRWRYSDWTHKTSFNEYSLDFVLYNAGFHNNTIFDEPHYYYTYHGIIGKLETCLITFAKKVFRTFLRIAYSLELGLVAFKMPLNPNIISVSK